MEFKSAANTDLNRLTYTYGTYENRIKSIEGYAANLTAPLTNTSTRYYLGNYERLGVGTSKRHIYYIAANGINAIITYDENTNTTVPDANTYQTYYTFTDHLGSILTVVNGTSTTAAPLIASAVQYNYDAWGRERRATGIAEAWVSFDMPTAATTGVTTWLNRGYTAHEQLRTFALINMNGRMYDPALGRMLSPDNYAGLDGTTQSYNQYSYVQNNPLKYTDPTGEFLLPAIALITDAIGAAFNGGLDFGNNAGRDKAWSSIDPTGSWSKTGKALRIDAGLFETDPHKSTIGRIWEVASRFTLQLPQEIMGNMAAHIDNLFNGVEDVSYFDGATIVRSKKGSLFDNGAFTLGSYIHGTNDLTTDLSSKNGQWLQHEYGHYVQSQNFGLFYLPFFALPSLASATFGTAKQHNGFYTEQGANYYGNEHLRDYYPTVGWKNDSNPLFKPNSGFDALLLVYQMAFLLHP